MLLVGVFLLTSSSRSCERSHPASCATSFGIMCSSSPLGLDVVIIITLIKNTDFGFIAVSAFCWGSYAEHCILRYHHWYHMKITSNGDTDDFCGHKCLSFGLSCLSIHQRIHQATAENLDLHPFYLTSHACHRENCWPVHFQVSLYIFIAGAAAGPISGKDFHEGISLLCYWSLNTC